MLVVDASIVVAALIDDSDTGRWADDLLVSTPLIAPHLLGVEVASTLRRAQLAGRISADVASLAHADLVDLRVEHLPYELTATRSWELRSTVTSYDAWYVAVAELLGAPLATLDARLVSAPGPTCQFVTPPG